jgi:demethylmenaquinone methyltransferase/2-methoxy-6-polyprenyl-1,4-benzoquinol methylase
MENIYDSEYVRKLFNQMSNSYERMNYITSFGFSIRWRKQFLDKLGKSTEKLHIIDLLSGLGENWEYLNRNFPNATFSALDFSEEMLKNSQTKANKIFKGKLNLICQNILKSNLESENYDIVCCAYGLKTFDENQIETLSKELYRILKKGGKFSFVEVSKPQNSMLRWCYQLYLSKIIPILGKLFLANPNDYKMLWIYVDNFNNCIKIKKIFEKNGLTVHFDNYFFGCATGINGTK